MRHAIAIASGCLFVSLGCSHLTSDPLGTPSPSPAPVPTAGEAQQAGAPAEKTYRVPIEGLPQIGDARALVTIVAFTDYQCPYCQRAEGTLDKLRASYGTQVRLVYAEAPLPMHDRARPAAIAALAAAEQGAFERMHARLFQGPLDDAAITRAADELGLDRPRFEADRAGAAGAALARSQALAEHLGVHGTPTFFINGRRVVGAQTLETFQSVIDERLAAARALVAGGVRAADVYARAVAGGAEHVEEADGEGGKGCHADGDCDAGAEAVGDFVERVPTAGASVRGPAGASITIVEFADYECPFCARAEAVLHEIEQAHPHDVRVVWKNMPLPFHTHARPMARAALAAEAQGRFWEMHDRLFGITGSLDRTAFERAAQDLALDVARFDRDLDDPALDARITADRVDGESLGVTGTPTFFVNGHRVVGAQPAAVFEKAIAKR